MRNSGTIPIQRIEFVDPPSVNHTVLAGGIPLYTMSGGVEPVLHLEMIFRAGKGHERHRAASHATAALISEGTAAMNSRQIAEHMDFYGATLRVTTGVDAMSVSLYCMARMLEPTLDLLTKLLVEAVFPESELAIYKQNRIQKIRIAMEQNETIANKRISESMFGTHVYGQTTVSEDVAGLTRDHVLEHYQLLGYENLTVFLSGQVQDAHLRLVEAACARLKAGAPPRSYGPPHPQEVSFQRIKGPQAYQSAIRMGRQVVGRRHPDFAALFLLNAVLGGFFGARLMRNIRERQGLTYGIYSTIETLVKGACLIISTEAAVDKSDRVIAEIHKEISRLQEELVSDEEFEMVRNYLMGTLLMQLDGPLRSMDMIKTMIMESLDEAYFREFVRRIRETSAEDVRNAAQEYLAIPNMHTVIVG